MKTILLSLLFFCSNTFQAQDITGIVINSNFFYDVISPTEHNFTFQTSFSLGSGSTCPPFTDSVVTIVNDTLFVKGYYDIRGAWPTFFCERLDVVSYNQELPATVNHIRTSTNIITYDPVNPELPFTYEDVYIRDFDLMLSVDKKVKRDLLKLYPNPVISLLNINASIEYDEIVITNNLGQVVFSNKSATATINVESLSDGLYYLTLYSKGGNLGTTKFLKHSK